MVIKSNNKAKILLNFLQELKMREPITKIHKNK